MGERMAPKYEIGWATFAGAMLRSIETKPAQ